MPWPNIYELNLSVTEFSFSLQQETLFLFSVILPAVLLVPGMVHDNVHPGSLQQLLLCCPFA